MNANEDQRLQHQLDQRSIGSDSTDPNTQAYQALYEALATAPPSSLPVDFAGRTMHNVMRPQWYHLYGYALLPTAWILLSLFLCAIAMYYVDLVFFQNFTTWLLRFKEIIAFVFAALMLVQIGDHWLVRSK